ncbi:helix-turn-helix transcriptional regulator [Dysgonomonas sp. Marseille-P4677]|uniref:response regulator transcription factor n=1 Tax=Dysgonomonas sp. Marseille-P4677 TaxID=2364790 RepID=UPI0019126A0B|nr:helix-turn-helix transcriptional regulator [Dysgonomonas sp. Marseille-P4677]MBK5721312.1 helix-turn-helix transcriptional regulator [Dysgonomonas sp. Marseille-P4677]
MFDLRNIEFNNTPNGDVEVRPFGEPVFTLSEKHIAFIDALLDYTAEFYPECYTALSEEYTRFSLNRLNYRFRMARRLLRCNFGEFDSIMDIDHNGAFNFEEVKCPRIGECKYHNIICNPQFNSHLTPREFEIMELLYSGYKTTDIADSLIISIKTVEKHKDNTLRKLNLHSLSDFFLHATKYNLFKKK